MKDIDIIYLTNLIRRRATLYSLVNFLSNKDSVKFIDLIAKFTSEIDSLSSEIDSILFDGGLENGNN